MRGETRLVFFKVLEEDGFLEPGRWHAFVGHEQFQLGVPHSTTGRHDS